MTQLELELYEPITDYIGKVITDEPYVKILSPIRWSTKHRTFTALAQVEFMLCTIALKVEEII